MKKLSLIVMTMLASLVPPAQAGGTSDWHYTLHATYESPSTTEAKNYDCDLRQREPLACIVKINVGDYVGRIELAQWPHARKYDLYMHGDYDRIAGEKGDTWEYTAWKRGGLEPDDLDAIVWRVNHFGEAGRLTLSFTSAGAESAADVKGSAPASAAGGGSLQWLRRFFSSSGG